MHDVPSLDILKTAVNAIKKMTEQETKWSKTFDEMLDGRFVSKIYEVPCSAICKMIEELFNDKAGEYGSVFSWWLWETNFGETAKMWDKDKAPIPLSTVEDLYNYYLTYTLERK